MNRRGMLVSVLSLVGLVAVPAGAQTLPPPAPAGQMQQAPQLEPPPPYAPPRVDGEQLPLGAEMQGDAQPYGDPAQMAGQQPPIPQQVPGQEDPNAYQQQAVDLGPDNDIAQTYDDGYDPQAYTQFQSALAPYGSWDYDDSYGYVWTPAMSIVGAGFAPYASCGHWIRSEYGWTWVSDWNWGWAPFHYGRWVVRANGWSWVPGTMWGPAWVSWRSGNGYVGWAPLPPRGVRLAGWYGARSPWRFTPAANLAASRLAFVSPRYLPNMFARTSVVSTDRLLSRGRYNVHVNAGPSRGITAPPVTLSHVAPGVLPHVAVYPHAGVPVYARPWVRGPEAQRDPLTNGWHAGSPVVSSRPPAAPGANTFGGYARPNGYGYSATAVRPATPAGAPVYGRPAPSFGGRPSAGGAVPVAPRPAYQPPAMRAYAPVTRSTSYGAAPVMNSGGSRAFATAPVGGGGYSHFGGAPARGGYSHFGGAPAGGGYSHFGGAPAGGGYSHFGGGGAHFGGGGGGAHFGGGGGAHFGGGGGGHHR
ncbi:MAG TPA: DUF6600 domain-containing protein [Polyangia bacterium]|nr:DUF6600 domain-containing protein [Polyangia bacterium]